MSTEQIYPSSSGDQVEKKPWYKRWWAIALGVLLVLGLLGSIFGDDDEENGSVEAEETQDEDAAEDEVDEEVQDEDLAAEETDEQLQEGTEEDAEAEDAQEEEPEANDDAETSRDAEESSEPEAEALEIEVVELHVEGESILQVLYQVDDAFTTNAVQRNLKRGCVEAIQTVKVETPGWYDHDTMQCAGMMGQALNIGTAEFSVALLTEISDAQMSDDPEAFWDMAHSTHIAPQYR